MPVSADLVNYYNSLCVSHSMSVEFEEATRGQSASEEWHKLRRCRITASNFKRICSRRGDFESVAASLLTSRSVTTAAMKYGIENEPVAAEVYARTFGRNVHRVGFVINPSCCFIGASPAGEYLIPSLNRIIGVC